MDTVLEPIKNTSTHFDLEGRAIVRQHLPRLSTEMAQQLIAHAMAMPLDELKLKILCTDQGRWQPWERKQCEHELTILHNIYRHRMEQTHAA